VTTAEPTTVYLALGSNLGDRAGAIARALALLGARGVSILARSPIYETDPVTPDPQPLYLNAVARAETALSAEALLALCLDVEHALGRRRPPGRAQAPREIDIDLLLYGDAIIGAADPAPAPARTAVRAHPAPRRRRARAAPSRDRRAPGPRRARSRGQSRRMLGAHPRAVGRRLTLATGIHRPGGIDLESDERRPLDRGVGSAVWQRRELQPARLGTRAFDLFGSGELCARAARGGARRDDAPDLPQPRTPIRVLRRIGERLF
jgi:2-amino-4-hydroxy-6-hydroxymethyldihydropteridine diphosphokinase